ncbi:MAG: hypothetical protein WCP09_01315 [Candidatus Taylorbacteria bacterium]
MSKYISHFKPTASGLDILISGRILAPGEKPYHMVERVVGALVGIEEHFGTNEQEMNIIAQELGSMIDDRHIVLSTPIMTNAGRYLNRPLSACTVPLLDLAHDDINHICKVITNMHEDGMGTGFCLDHLDDPVGMLRKLNDIALQSSRSGKEDRPVGNMATLRFDSAHILEFIRVKIGADQRGEAWKFNISIDCGYDFFDKIEKNDFITMSDGSRCQARYIFDEIVNAVHLCAEPGLIFIDRMEADNPTPCVGHYLTTAPCAEVGLTSGESCQFGYLNLATFIEADGKLDVDKLKKATRLITRILDNALEISIQNYTEMANRIIASKKRKIGIGVCGLADALIKSKLLYSSPEAREFAFDIITLINFESKKASYELAKNRGSFGAMSEMIGNRHIENPSFIDCRYGSLESKYVGMEEWSLLSEKIRSNKMLRNASTIALPPTGRCALVFGASAGIEPIFSKDLYKVVNPDLLSNLYQYIETANQIKPIDHLRITAALQRGVDESISKTINMVSDITREEIGELYKAAWNFGLKGITVYREGSKVMQPNKL